MPETLHARIGGTPPDDYQAPPDDRPVDPCPVPEAVWQPTPEAYRLHASVSSTSLKLFRADPQAYQRRHVYGIAAPKKRKPHFDVGAAFCSYFCDPEFTPPGSAANAARVAAMIAATQQADPGTWLAKIHKLLTTSAGRSEWAALWTHESGILCRIRVDRLIGWRDPWRLLNSELKTSRHSDPRGFTQDAERFEYYHQVAFYEAGLRAIFPDVPVSSWIGFVSSSPPHAGWCHTPPPGRLAQATEENDAALFEMAELLKRSGDWPRRIQPWEHAVGEPPLDWR
jgi:hypothetical protein